MLTALDAKIETIPCVDKIVETRSSSSSVEEIE